MTATNCGLWIADCGLTCGKVSTRFQRKFVVPSFHLKSAIRNLKSAIESGRWCRRFLGVFLVKAFDTTGGVNQLLLAREKRVASRADFNVDFIFA